MLQKKISNPLCNIIQHVKYLIQLEQEYGGFFLIHSCFSRIWSNILVCILSRDTHLGDCTKHSHHSDHLTENSVFASSYTPYRKNSYIFSDKDDTGGY